MPFSPLGRAFLAGVVRNTDELEEGDMRKSMPRFSDENIEHNLQLVDEFTTIADDYSCTPAQLALAWVMAQAPCSYWRGTRFAKRKMEASSSPGSPPPQAMPASTWKGFPR